MPDHALPPKRIALVWFSAVKGKWAQCRTLQWCHLLSAHTRTYYTNWRAYLDWCMFFPLFLSARSSGFLPSIFSLLVSSDCLSVIAFSVLIYAARCTRSKQSRRQEELSLTKREKLFLHFRGIIFFKQVFQWDGDFMSKDGRRQPWATSMIVMTIRLFVKGDKPIPSSPLPLLLALSFLFYAYFFKDQC